MPTTASTISPLRISRRQCGWFPSQKTKWRVRAEKKLQRLGLKTLPTREIQTTLVSLNLWVDNHRQLEAGNLSLGDTLLADASTYLVLVDRE
jgi:hypothetical protein